MNKYIEKIAEFVGLEKEAGNAAKILRRIEGKKYGKKGKIFDPSQKTSENINRLRDALHEKSIKGWNSKPGSKTYERGAKAYGNRYDLNKEIVKTPPKGVKVSKKRDGDYSIK